MAEETTHKIYFNNANNLSEAEDNSVSLVVTSPPYPMIEMWDESFSSQNKDIAKILKKGESEHAFELKSHLSLTSVPA